MEETVKAVDGLTDREKQVAAQALRDASHAIIMQSGMDVMGVGDDTDVAFPDWLCQRAEHIDGVGCERLDKEWRDELVRAAKIGALEETADDLARRIADDNLNLMADRYGGHYSGLRTALRVEERTLRTRIQQLKEEA